MLLEGILPEFIAEVEPFIVPPSTLSVMNMKVLQKVNFEKLKAYKELLVTINAQSINSTVLNQLVRKVLRILAVKVESLSSAISQQKSQVSILAGTLQYALFY